MSDLVVLVTGGRGYDNREHVFAVLDRIDQERGPIVTIVEGGCRKWVRRPNGTWTVIGADAFASDWARERFRRLRTIHADWARHGLKAGPIRNRQMIDTMHPNLCVAFVGGKGTADCVRQARAVGIEVIQERQ